MLTEPIVKAKMLDHDNSFYTRQIPIITNKQQKACEMMTTRANQISALKEKLKIKKKQDHEESFPSVYKLKEDLDEFKINHKRRTDDLALMDESDPLSYCSNTQKYHRTKKDQMVPRNGKTKSYEMHGTIDQNRGRLTSDSSLFISQGDHV